MALSNAERQRRYIEKLKAKAVKPAVSNEIAELGLQLTALRRQLAEADRTIAQLRKQLAAAKAGAERSAYPADQEIAELKRKLREVRTRLRKIAEAPKGAVHMVNSDRRKILACLHPDRVPDDQKRRYEQAFKAFAALPIHEIKIE
jgi:chromosome segregation ATPase